MRGLRVLMLGRPRLELDGQPLTRLLAVKQQAIVWFLAAERGPITRSALCNLLWADADAPAARASLRVALSRLRQALPGFIQSDSQSVGWAETRLLAVDLSDLERAMDGGRSLERHEARLRAARAWRGPLLDGFEVAGGGAEAFGEWLAQRRVRAQRAAVALRTALMQASEATGDLDDALAHAQALLDIDDADESAHVCAMRLLSASGRRVAAIAQYEACRAALAARLGARPSPQTYALYTRIHAGGASAAAAGGAATGGSTAARPAAPEWAIEAVAALATATSGVVPEAPAELAARCVPIDRPRRLDPAIADSGPTSLVGREVELAAILERLLDPGCRWLTLVGPGGIGKTRLARAAATRFAARRADLESGAANHPEALWFSAIDDAALLADHDAFVARVHDRLRDQPPTAGAALIVLDNLESLENVGSVRRLQQSILEQLPAVSVLATSRVRIGGGREWLFEVPGLSLARDASQALASSEAARLFLQCVRRLEPSFDGAGQGAAIEAICARVGGLPLAIEMAARSAWRQPIASIAANEGLVEELTDPDRDLLDRQRSLRSVIAGAWQALDGIDRAAAQRVAVLDGDFDAALAAAIGVDADRLDALRARSWLQGSGDGRLRTHPLQRDFLRSLLDADIVAAQVDEAVAAWLEAKLPALAAFSVDIAAGPLLSQRPVAEVNRAAHVPAERAATVAPIADVECPTVPILLRVLASALDSFDRSQLDALIDRVCGWLLREDRERDADTLLGFVLSHPRGDAPAWRSAGLWLVHGEIAFRLGDSMAAMRRFSAGFARLGLGEFEYARGVAGQWLPSLVNAALLRSWPARTDSARAGFERLVLRCLLLVGQLSMFSPVPHPMARAAMLLTVTAWRSRSPIARLAAATVSAWGPSLFGWPRFARALTPQRLDAIERSGPDDVDPSLAAATCGALGALRFATGDWVGLPEWLDGVVERATSLRARRLEMEARSLGAKLAFYQGMLEAARQRFAALAERSAVHPGAAWRHWGPLGLAEVALCAGGGTSDAQAVARRLFDEGTRLMTEFEIVDAAYTMRRLGIAARLAVEAGDPEAIREAVLAGVAAAARIRFCGFWAHEGYAGIGDALIVLWADERERGGSITPLRLAWVGFEPTLRGHARRFPPATATWLRLRGAAEHLMNRPARAKRLVERAVREAERCGMRVELARGCDALTVLDPAGDWARRSAALWQAMRKGK